MFINLIYKIDFYIFYCFSDDNQSKYIKKVYWKSI